jgi:hypothetical protein
MIIQRAQKISALRGLSRVTTAQAHYVLQTHPRYYSFLQPMKCKSSHFVIFFF